MAVENTNGLNRQFNGITEAALDALQKRIGQPIEDSLEPWCHEASRDTIRHYAHGIGDDNPLWCDPVYARDSCHAGIIAPPSFLFACDRVISGYVGDFLLIHGEVIGKQKRGDQYLVEIRQHATNQDGELSIEGTAIVALPNM